MPRSIFALAVFACVAFAGCQFHHPQESYSGGGSGWSSDPYANHTISTAHGPPASCGMTHSEMQWFSAAANAADYSIHELIACGGAQVALARTLFVAVFAGNEEVFDYDPETLEQVRTQLGAFQSAGQLPFENIGQGKWRMKNTAGTSAGVAFDVLIHEPAGAIVTDNPFMLESYLQGVTVTYAMTFEQMKAAPTSPNTYTIKWQKLGPLGSMLAGARGEVPNPIVLHISAMDFLATVDGNGSAALFGPFANLLDVGLSSHVDLVQKRPGGEVRYDMQAPREALRTAALNSVVAFQVVGLNVANGSRSLHSVGSGKLGAQGYGLVGTLTLAGQRQDGGKIEVDLKYTGGTYANEAWRCD